MKMVGSMEQERRLEEMGELAHQVAPEIEVVAFKGVFRYAIESAMKRHDVPAWSDMSSRGAEEKKLFFESVLEFARERLLVLGLVWADEKKIADIVKDRIFHEIDASSHR